MAKKKAAKKSKAEAARSKSRTSKAGKAKKATGRTNKASKAKKSTRRTNKADKTKTAFELPDLTVPSQRRIAGGYKEPKNAFDRFVIEFLRQTIEQLKQISPKLTEAYHVDSWLLRHGKFFCPGALPETYEVGEDKQCFLNAQTLAIDDNRLDYVEGYASHIFPCRHAWCVTADGQIIDPTWHGRDGHFMGKSYFGVGIETAYVRKAIVENKRYDAVLDYSSVKKLGGQR
jgi:hypothetical protein